VEQIEETIESKCESDGCKENTFQAVQSTNSYYNGYQVSKISGTLSTALKDCPSLPAPTTSDDLKHLQAIMKKEDTVTQPLTMKSMDQYLYYENMEIFSANFQPKTAPTGDNELKTFILRIDNGEIKLDYVAYTDDTINFLCLKERGNFRYNEKAVKDMIRRILKGLETIQSLIKRWSNQLMRCHQTTAHSSAGTETEVTQLTFTRELRRTYYYIVRNLREGQLDLPAFETTMNKVENLRNTLSGMYQEATRCQLGQCKVEIGSERIYALCRDTTEVRGTILRGTPVPYDYEGQTRLLVYGKYMFDYSFKTCRSMIEDVEVSLDPTCCKELVQKTIITHCPYTVMNSAPLYYEVGSTGYLVSPDSTSVTTQCGTTNEEFTVKQGQGIFTDCSVQLRKGGVSLAIPGFGSSMYSHLAKKMVDASYVFTTAEIGLISLATLVVLSIGLFIICKCAICGDIICNIMRCCTGKSCIKPSAPGIEEMHSQALQERVRLYFDQTR
jgi:hypothetical protein